MSDTSNRHSGNDDHAHPQDKADTDHSTQLSSVEILRDAKTPVYIGDATMDKDGTINLHMRRTADGIHTNGMFRYKPGTKDYDEVFCHIGGIRPGETKLVKPFEEADKACVQK